MKAYQFVTLTRIPERPDMDSTQMALTMAGHLAHLDSLFDAGIIRLVGPFGDERALRGFALLDVADSAAAMAHMSVDPSVKAGIFSWTAGHGGALLSLTFPAPRHTDPTWPVESIPNGGIEEGRGGPWPRHGHTRIRRNRL